MDSFLTACTGMDALSHAFEAYVSNASSAFTDLYAIEAVKLIIHNLNASVEYPNNLQLRGKVMLGSLYAGLAFSNASLGCVHSMAHSLGGYLDLPHGECNAIILPHVVDFNYSSATEKYSNLSAAMGCCNKSTKKTDARKQLVNFLIDFRNSVNIKSTLGSNGVKPDIIPTLASKAINDPCNATNPRPPCKLDLECIYKEAI
jgi:alcohol dehydrogenase class IV